MLRRLHAHQPAAFAFTPANHVWATKQMTKFPEGRQASAIIPLLWRAQEQEGWLSRPAIEAVADMLGLAYIRALEVATFYFMFQLQPVGSVAHVQVCGTTTCMICGAESLIEVCRNKIAAHAHDLSADGKFSWEEVECLGACTNAPMVQIGKDFYEDLTPAKLGEILDELAAGRVPVPGPQNGRYAAEPLSGLTTLKAHAKGREAANYSVAQALEWGDTVKRIVGGEMPVPKVRSASAARVKPLTAKLREPLPGANATIDATGISKQRAQAVAKRVPPTSSPAKTAVPLTGRRPEALKTAPNGKADDLKIIKGIGPALERLLHGLGVFHLDQIAVWNAADVAWLDENLEGFKGRVSRDDWVSQAKILARR